MTERNPIPACLSHLEQMLPKPPDVSGFLDLPAEAAALVARWEQGSEEHRQWLREVAVPDVIAFAIRIRAQAVEEALAAGRVQGSLVQVPSSFLGSAVGRMAIDFSGGKDK